MEESKSQWWHKKLQVENWNQSLEWRRHDIKMNIKRYPLVFFFFSLCTVDVDDTLGIHQVKKEKKRGYIGCFCSWILDRRRYGGLMEFFTVETGRFIRARRHISARARRRQPNSRGCRRCRRSGWWRFSICRRLAKWPPFLLFCRFHPPDIVVAPSFCHWYQLALCFPLVSETEKRARTTLTTPSIKYL